jgi:anti-sigma regulatory factor (Ser/Thr protein kinase)
VEAAVKSIPTAAQLRYVIDDESKIGEARRAAQVLANYEIDAETAGRVAIATSELATNALRHGGGGEILIQAIGIQDSIQIEVLAVDRGPGMTDIERCMRDGYSTGGTMGTGLGAVRRLANEFDIHSIPGEGTVVMARFGSPLALRFGAVNIAMHGEIDCGDAWRLTTDGKHIALFVVDGLGHGTLAAEAARTGAEAFMAKPFAPPQEVMLRADAAMSRTRGGAAACALLNGSSLAYAGIGNIGGTLVSPGKSQGLVSHAGTLGRQARRSQQFEYQREPGAMLIMHSDGLSARWNLRERPGLLSHHPAIVAAVLYRDFGRDRDDSTVVVIA